MKLNSDSGTQKTRNYELNIKNKNQRNINRNDLKIINLSHKKEENKKLNSSYSKKYKEARNIKIGNYLKKYNSLSGYGTNINTPKKPQENIKIQNKNNLLRIIPINRKNYIKEKTKINDYIKKEKLINNNNRNKLKNQFLKLNNQNLNIETNKEKIIQKHLIQKKVYLTEEKLNEENIPKIKISENPNTKDKKFFNQNKIYDKKIIPAFSKRNRNLNILQIRKQKSKEEDALARRNTGIIEIKIDNKTSSSRYSFNNYKSLPYENQKENIGRFNTTNENLLKKYNSNNSNHNFVIINLCKDKDKTNSDIIKVKDKFLTKQNSFPKFKFQISIRNDENQRKNSNDNDIDKKSKKICNINNKIVYKSFNSSKGNLTFNNKTEENEKNNFNIYNKQIKIYDIGKYEGIIINNKRESKGLMIYNNGARYEGEWKNDKKNGKGIYISSSYLNSGNNLGLKYEGDFLNDKFEGFGIATFSNGDIYEGEWKNNKQHGRGTLTNIGGTKYIGEWIQGIFEGNGIYYMINGERYEGHFINNKYDGYGKYFYNNGDYLEGIFKEDQPTNNCILHTKYEHNQT